MMYHRIGGGWTICLPDSYSAEYVDNERIYKFVDDESNVTIRLSPMFAEKDGKPVPKEVLRNAFAHSLDSLKGRAVLRDDDHAINDEMSSMSFEYTYFDDKNELNFYISCGIYTDGALLSANVSGTVREDCEKALGYILEVTK